MSGETGPAQSDKLKKWKDEARSDRPTKDDWIKLCVLLRNAGEIPEDSPIDPDAPGGLHSSWAALDAVIEFLQKRPHLLEAGAAAPLIRLSRAMVEVTEGQSPPIFRPKVKRGGSPGKGVPDSIVGYAARAMEDLMQGGSEPRAAAREVASRLKSGGYRNITSVTVTNWRDGCRNKPGQRVSNISIEAFNDPRVTAASSDPTQRARRLLERLGRARTLIG